GTAAARVVDRQRHGYGRGGAAGERDHVGEQFVDGELDRVAEVDRGETVELAVHQRDQPRDHIGHVAEAAGLATVAID
nr:hypothetical protein [Tanacetum cinerariifolium]